MTVFFDQASDRENQTSRDDLLEMAGQPYKRNSKPSEDYKSILHMLLALLFSVCIVFPAAAEEEKPGSPLAVLKSKVNASAYQDQHLGTFDNDFKEFVHTLGTANVRFDMLADNDLSDKGKLARYKLIVLPLMVDLPSGAVAGLREYHRGGGRILVTDAGGALAAGAREVAAMAGIAIDRQVTFKDPASLVWTESPLPIKEEFAVGTMVAHLTPGPEVKIMARWRSGSQKDLPPAVIRKNNIAYMGWPPGVQGDLVANARFLSMTLDELSPGITQNAAIQISFAEYQTIKGELEYLKKRTEETIQTAKQAEFAVSTREIQDNFKEAVENVDKFHKAYKARHYLDADEALARARMMFALAFAQAMPVRPVEARSIWLDRGTIVSTRGPAGMAQLFEKLKSSGINVVYFETNNAGFTMYPSKLTKQNPETLGWDPLGCACQEATKRGMEIHAWVWVFSVGNARHNPIIKLPADYPGPVLNKYDFNWALAAKNGSMLPPRQFEYWLDPSNSDCRTYVKNLIAEIVDSYKVDGVQLDYIRYPFNNRGSEMGFNWLSRIKFEQETGLSLDKLDEETRKVFIAWKSQQVNQFVKEASRVIRGKNPKLRISAAVYAFPRRMRINAIQQEWETWVANGWVDTLNPMTYAHTTKKLSIMADYVREATSDKALVYPGLAIRRVDTAGLIEQLDTARATGTLGTTMFAVAHLDDKKMRVLRVGPYRRQTLLTPQSAPIRASRFLVDDFAAMVNRYLHDPRTHILSDTASTNDVVSQIESIQRTMHDLRKDAAPEQIEAAIKDVSHLHSTVREWLRLEAFIQRGFRAQYIVNYLSQVEAILAYASHRARVSAKLKRPAMAGANIR